jgi:hypothetical protein
VSIPATLASEFMRIAAAKAATPARPKKAAAKVVKKPAARR